MATHSSILAWKISWTEESGGLQSMGLQSRARLSSQHLPTYLGSNKREHTPCNNMDASQEQHAKHWITSTKNIYCKILLIWRSSKAKLIYAENKSEYLLLLTLEKVTIKFSTLGIKEAKEKQETSSQYLRGDKQYWKHEKDNLFLFYKHQVTLPSDLNLEACLHLLKSSFLIPLLPSVHNVGFFFFFFPAKLLLLYLP